MTDANAGQRKPLTEFYRNRARTDRHDSACAVCSRLSKRQHTRHPDYQRLLDKQRGVCAICFGEPKGRTHFDVDHDDKTGQVRGLLCTNCNRGLGYFQDDWFLLRRASEYLREHYG